MVISSIVPSLLAVLGTTVLVLMASRTILQRGNRIIGPLLSSGVLFSILLVALPQANFKIVTMLTSRDSKQRLAEEDDTFPLGLFIAVLSFMLSAIFDRTTQTQTRPASDPLKQSQPDYSALDRTTSFLLLGTMINSLSNFYFVGLAVADDTFSSEVLTELAYQTLLCLGLGFQLRKSSFEFKTHLTVGLLQASSVVAGLTLGAYFHNMEMLFSLSIATSSGVLLYTITQLQLPLFFASQSNKIPFLGCLIGFGLACLNFPLQLLLSV